jgi:hypothetical protein
MLWQLFKLYLLGMLLFALYSLAPQIPEIMTTRCQHKWQASGMASRWEYGNGCMVEVDSRWIPEANVQVSLKGR